MKYAVNTNFLKNKYNPKEIIEQALLAGVQGIEWGLGKVENAAADAKEASKLAKDAGLEVFSFINGGKLWHKDEMLRWSEAVASAGAKMLRVSHPWFGYNYDETVRQPETFPALMQRALDGLAVPQPLMNSRFFCFMPREYSGKYTIPEGITNIISFAFEHRLYIQIRHTSFQACLYRRGNFV